MKLRRLGVILLIALATVVALQYLQTEATIDRCYRECGLCGLSRGEVARLIQDEIPHLASATHAKDSRGRCRW